MSAAALTPLTQPVARQPVTDRVLCRDLRMVLAAALRSEGLDLVSWRRTSKVSLEFLFRDGDRAFWDVAPWTTGGNPAGARRDDDLATGAARARPAAGGGKGPPRGKDEERPVEALGRGP